MFNKTRIIKLLGVFGMLCTPTAFAFFLPPVEEELSNTTEKFYEIGITTGLFRLSPDNRTYATSQPNVIAGSATHLLKVDPKYKLGGGIDFVYGSTYKLKGTYFESRNNQARNHRGFIGTTLAPPVWGDINARAVNSNLHSRYSIATLSITDSFNLNYFTITPGLGISYLTLAHTHRTLYGNLGGGAAAGQIDLRSKFKGMGHLHGTFWV